MSHCTSYDSVIKIVKITVTLFNFCLFYRFDATWESMGCHESSQGATKLVRCTCETDHCNAESADWMQNKVTTKAYWVKYEPISNNANFHS